MPRLLQNIRLCAARDNETTVLQTSVQKECDTKLWISRKERIIQMTGVQFWFWLSDINRWGCIKKNIWQKTACGNKVNKANDDDIIEGFRATSVVLIISHTILVQRRASLMTLWSFIVRVFLCAYFYFAYFCYVCVSQSWRVDFFTLLMLYITSADCHRTGATDGGFAFVCMELYCVRIWKIHNQWSVSNGYLINANIMYIWK